jgi:glyceraldehyde 3-phosphate dehydrogenase
MEEQKIRVAINGFGRIGRLFFRIAFDRPELDIVAINDLGDVDNLAYLLKYDTVYGRYQKEVKVEVDEKGGKKFLVVDGKKIQFLQEKDPERLPWKDLNVDIVVESTGVFESFEKASAHLKAGAKRVVISAPAKDEDYILEEGKKEVPFGKGRTILLGINDDEIGLYSVTSNGSCTTNSIHPVLQILHQALNIKKAFLTTVHAYTATQNLVDGVTKGKDWRRGRAAAQNISPSSTGAAVATTRVLSDLKGKFDGVAMRVPTVTGSASIIVALVSRKTTVEEVNDIFRKAVELPRWKDIVKVTEDQIVSSDIIGEPYAAIVDLTFTRVIDGDLVAVLSWYDNEMGYCHTLLRHVIEAGKYIK